MNNDSNMISVIMPCYNQKFFVEEAIRNVMEQSYQNIELIVVDDGSTDNTPDILKKLENEYKNRKIKMLHQKNQGPYPARNYALKNAHGKYVAFLDADDFWEKEFLKKMHHRLVMDNADLVYCGWQNIGKNAINGNPFIPDKYGENGLMMAFLKSCQWPIHAALTTKRMIDSVGGFSQRYFSSMDYDLWIKIVAQTKKIKRVPEVLSYYRWHDHGQISSVKWKQEINSWRVRKDFVETHPELVAKIDTTYIHEYVEKYIIKSAYRAYWHRDLRSARRLFQKSLFIRSYEIRDLKYILPSFMPELIYRLLLSSIDRLKNKFYGVK